MANLSAQSVLESGLIPSMTASAGGGDAIENNTGKEFVFIKNGGGGGITVTFTVQNTDASSPQFGEITKGDRVVSIGAGAEQLIGPFARGAFNDANGRCQITYSGVTSVTIAVLKLG